MTEYFYVQNILSSNLINDPVQYCLAHPPYILCSVYILQKQYYFN